MNQKLKSAALLISLACAGTSSAATKPNIIVILCDDLGYNDVGCFTYPSKTNPGPPPAAAPTTYAPIGAPNSAYDATKPDQTLTPNIDSLATQGIIFKNSHTSPVCSASRSSLMTGCYAPRVNILGVLAYNDTNGLNTTEVTLPAILKTAGYATACVGKWHLGHYPQFLPTRRGFDEFFGLPFSNNMTGVALYAGETPIQTIAGDAAAMALLTQRFTARALDFIERNQSRPFLLYMPHPMPHIPVYPSANFVGASGKGSYYDVVMEIDWSVGQIVDKLKALNLDNNTLIVFTSDNGPYHTHTNLNLLENAVGSAYPLYGCKTTSWEGGVRTPFIARWPGRIPAGTSTDEVVGLIDLLPTLTKLAGSGPPTDRVIDGADIWPLMSGSAGAVSPHNPYYVYDSASLEGVISGQWKLRPLKSGTSLYNLASDIQEQTDVAAANPSVVTQLQGLANSFSASLNANKRAAGVYSAQRPAILRSHQFRGKRLLLLPIYPEQLEQVSNRLHICRDGHQHGYHGGNVPLFIELHRPGSGCLHGAWHALRGADAHGVDCLPQGGIGLLVGDHQQTHGRGAGHPHGLQRQPCSHLCMER